MILFSRKPWRLSIELLFHIVLVLFVLISVIELLPSLSPVYKGAIIALVGILSIFDLYFVAMRKSHVAIVRIIMVSLSLMLLASLLIYYISAIMVFTDAYGVEELLVRYGATAMWLFFLLCFAQPIVLPLPEALTIPAGSAVLGPFTAGSLAVTGTTLGIFVMFWIARIGGMKLATKWFKKERIDQYHAYVQRHETVVLTLLFIIPVLPDEIICIGAGLSGISFRRFAIIVIISKLITSYMLAYSVLVAEVIGLTPSQFIIGGTALLAAMFLIGVVTKRVLEKNAQ